MLTELEQFAEKVLGSANSFASSVEAQRLLFSTNWLSKVKNASWHPLGFACLKLGLINSDTTIRLHIWPKFTRKYQTPHWPIHDHIFELSSLIVLGNVTNELYEVTATSDKKEATHKIFNVSYQNDFSITRSTNQFVNCRLISQLQYSANDVYQVPANCYHQSKVPEELTAVTLCITTLKQCKSPRVLGEISGPEELTYQRVAISEPELHSLLSEIQTEIATS